MLRFRSYHINKFAIIIIIKTIIEWAYVPVSIVLCLNVIDIMLGWLQIGGLYSEGIHVCVSVCVCVHRLAFDRIFFLNIKCSVFGWIHVLYVWCTILLYLLFLSKTHIIVITTIIVKLVFALHFTNVSNSSVFGCKLPSFLCALCIRFINNSMSLTQIKILSGHYHTYGHYKIQTLKFTRYTYLW